MNVHISYKIRKTPGIEKEISHCIEKLRTRLQAFRPELVHLKGLIEEHSPREGITVSFNLRLPSGQMAVEKSAATAVAALKVASDDLLQQVSKHKGLLRSSHTWSRRRAGRTRATSQVEFENTVASLPPLTASPDDIRTYVNANFLRLERFVERELVLREAAGEIGRNSVATDEVVDEAVVLALTDGEEKPDRMGMEAWFYRLAIRALDNLTATTPEDSSEMHLEETTKPQNERASDEAELQFHQPDESLTAENVIADKRIATPEDIVYSDEMIGLVQRALQGTVRPDREAFVLYAIEGFTVEEIVAITDRKPEQVRASIAAARQKTRQIAAVPGRTAKGSLQPTGTD